MTRAERRAQHEAQRRYPAGAPAPTPDALHGVLDSLARADEQLGFIHEDSPDFEEAGFAQSEIKSAIRVLERVAATDGAVGAAAVRPADGVRQEVWYADGEYSKNGVHYLSLASEPWVEGRSGDHPQKPEKVLLIREAHREP